ncbi:response regulator [Pseudomonas sp. nanlin1]|uniref:response regulator n=1 Tax=Pseudomonas sp. nanlin1 TaxID=3040605 RepID=UPI0038908F93
MSDLQPTSERAIILAPMGRDSQIAIDLLARAGYTAVAARDLPHLCDELRLGAGLAIIANEALHHVDLSPLTTVLSEQPAWSDLPVVFMTHHGGPNQTPATLFGNQLGNVTFLERPFHPVTLISLVTTAIRGRRRQYEARARLLDLSESEQRLQHALTAGRLGAWQLDLPSYQLTSSALTRAHYGYGERQAFTFQDWQNSIHVLDRPKASQALRNSIEYGADYSLQYRNQWADGSVHWVDVRARAIHNSRGEVTGLVGVSADVTERKLAEEQLRALNENLEQQVEERSAQVRLNEEALRQSQKMEAVGQLTGGIAHDFNNMLTGIIGSLELMRRRLARGRTEEFAHLIELGITSANRAAGLTHRLLAFSRRQSLDSKPVRMNQLVQAMDELLQRSLNESIHLDMHLSDDLWVAEADPHQLESALLNLVLNARDAMPNGGQLRVRTSNTHLDPAFTAAHPNLQPGDYVQLSVADSGCGMPDSVIQRAFDPFFTTKPIGQGTGLGLSMIYGFSKQSRGHVAIESQMGVGTTVRLYLPRFVGVESDDTVIMQSPVVRARQGESVLIVEDDGAVRHLVCEVLNELGYSYLEAGHADAALAILESAQRIDLLISDVGLPGMNGRQLADIARQLRPGLKVLFITGYAEHAAVRAGFLDEGMQMITKPFAFDLLTARVREMIEA